MNRAGWIRIAPTRGEKGASYRHVASGWVVHHCGHPTAHTPYWATDPKHPDAQTVGPRGCWRYLDGAQASVEAYLAGTCRTTAERCAPGVRSIQPRQDPPPGRPCALTPWAEPCSSVHDGVHRCLCTAGHLGRCICADCGVRVQAAA